MVLSALVIDRHVLDWLTIFGLLLGALGAIYLAYEYFSPNQLLKRLTLALAKGIGFIMSSFLLFGIFHWLGAPKAFGDVGISFDLIFWIGTALIVLLGVVISLRKPLPTDRGRPPLLSWTIRANFWAGISGAICVAVILRFWKYFPLNITSLVIIIGAGLLFGVIVNLVELVERWSFRLTDGQLGGLGAIFIVCGFLLTVVQPLVDAIGP